MTRTVSAPPVLAMNNITFAYSERRVFDDLCLTVDDGLTFLVGENGAGKTTLFKLLLGSLKPRRGSIHVGGTEITGRKASAGLRGHIGYLPQDFHYPPHARAGDLVCYLAWLRGVPRKRARRAAEEALAAVGLVEVEDQPMASLSGGMVRRVGIAQALAHRPALLLLDEPTVGLDPEQRVRLRELLRDLSQDTSIVSSTHLLEDAGLTGGDIIVLAGGVVRFRGSAAGLVEASTAESPVTVAASPLEAAYMRLTQGTGPR